MQPAPIPANEEERLLSLHKLGLLDTEPEERFDRITRTATKIFNVPISTLTLVDSRREWFKSCEGLPEREGDRAISFCGHALLVPDIFIIPDTKLDPRFSDNPMVIGKPFIRFYAGVPILNADGQRVGVFCIKDTKPREFSEQDKSVLKGLAGWAELEVNSHNLSIAMEERQKLQEKLIQRYKESEASRAKEFAILESIGDGLLVIGKTGVVIEMNNAAGRLLGAKPADYIGHNVREVLKIKNDKGEDVAPIDRPLQVALSTGKTVTSSTMKAFYYVRRDGTQFPVAITVTPVIFKKETIGAVGIFRDISREKEIDLAKTEFVSLAAHQLKTPPTAIKVLTETLLGKRIGTLSEKQIKYVENIRISNQRMIDIINALLKVSRIELGAFAVEVSERDAASVVQSTFDELRPDTDKKMLTVKMSLPEKGPMLQLDEPLYRMVISNLATNAIKYTPEKGEIKVEGKVVDKGQKFGGKIIEEASFVTSVADNGFGIPEAQQAKMFTKFFRADNAREKHTDGTGLGLYIIKSILEHSGGQIWYNSRENEGSVFFVAVPMTGMKAKMGSTQIVERPN